MTKLSASYLMEQISRYAPLALLFFAFLSFLAFGIFSVDYYKTLFEPRFKGSAVFMAILIAIIQEAVRFGLLVTSIKDFRDKKISNGMLGLVGSLCLVFHDISISNSIAKMWSSDPSPYSNLFVFLILIGLLLEFRLILTVGKSKTAPGNSFPYRGKSQSRSNGVNTAANN